MQLISPESGLVLCRPIHFEKVKLTVEKPEMSSGRSLSLLDSAFFVSSSQLEEAFT
jgi:hypothetical protein